MLREATQYESPVLDVLLVTDRADKLQKVVDRLQLPLNVSYYEAKQPANDSNPYWLTWEHRKAIQEAVSKHEYTAVVYMEVSNVCTALSWQLKRIIDYHVHDHTASKPGEAWSHAALFRPLAGCWQQPSLYLQRLICT
jgi:hypothetical protein